MFSFLKKAKPLEKFDFLGLDFHSHLLPGIDDGAQTIEDSVTLIKEMMNMGFDRFYTTPHVMSDLYPNTSEIILEKLKVVRIALQNEGISVPVFAAAEYLMDEAFGEKIAAGDLLTLPGNRVLVEMSFVSPSPNLELYVFQLQTKGYRVVLAHPERYLFYRNDRRQFELLKDRGVEFQVNLLSLLGYYGKPTLSNAAYLLEKGMVDYLATDLHHQKHAEQLYKLLDSSSVSRLLKKHKGEFKNKKLASLMH